LPSQSNIFTEFTFKMLHTRLWFSAKEESSWIEEEQNL